MTKVNPEDVRNYLRLRGDSIRWDGDEVLVMPTENGNGWVRVQVINRDTRDETYYHGKGHRTVNHKKHIPFSRWAFYEVVALAWRQGILAAELDEKREADREAGIDRIRFRSAKEKWAYEKAPDFVDKFLFHEIQEYCHQIGADKPVMDEARRRKGGAPVWPFSEKLQLMVTRVGETKPRRFQKRLQNTTLQAYIHHPHGVHMSSKLLAEQRGFDAVQHLISQVAHHVSHLSNEGPAVMDAAGLTTTQRGHYRTERYLDPKPMDAAGNLLRIPKDGDDDKGVKEGKKAGKNDGKSKGERLVTIYESMHLLIAAATTVVEAATMKPHTLENAEISRELWNLATRIAHFHPKVWLADDLYRKEHQYVVAAEFGVRLQTGFNDQNVVRGHGQGWREALEAFVYTPLWHKELMGMRSIVETVNGNIKVICMEFLRSKKRKQPTEVNPRHTEGLCKVLWTNCLRVIAIMLAEGIDHPCFHNDVKVTAEPKPTAPPAPSNAPSWTREYFEEDPQVPLRLPGHAPRYVPPWMQAYS